MFWGLALESWNNLIVAFGVISGVFVVLTGGATYIAFELQKAEARAASDALERFKLNTGSTIAEANARAETAHSEAERARLEQEKLKAVVQWRTISPSDMQTLVAELAKGSGEIDLAYSPADPESRYFATKILGDAFTAANKAEGGVKWHVYMRAWMSNAMLFGIAIPGPENDQVKFLRHAFSAARIGFTSEKLPDEVAPFNVGSGLLYAPPPDHQALIVIGLRMPPS